MIVEVVSIYDGRERDRDHTVERIVYCKRNALQLMVERGGESCQYNLPLQLPAHSSST